MRRLLLAGLAVWLLVACLVVPSGQAPAEDVIPRGVKLYLGKDGPSYTLNSTIQDSGASLIRQDPDAAWISGSWGYLETWYSDPMASNVTMDGPIGYTLWARAVNETLADVHFRIRLRNGSGEELANFETQTKDLDTTLSSFSGSEDAEGAITVRDGERLVMTLEWKAGELRNDAFLAGHNTIELAFGDQGVGSEVTIHMDSVRGSFANVAINDFDKNTVSFGVLAFSALGNADIANLSVENDLEGDFRLRNQTRDKDGVLFNVLWDFRFVEINKGTYTVLLHVEDRSGNFWPVKTNVTISPTNVWADLEVSSENITLDPEEPEQGDIVEVSIRVSGYGMNWEELKIDIELYDGESLMDQKTVSVGKNVRNSVEMTWIPAYAGEHNLIVIIREGHFSHPGKREENNEAQLLLTVLPPSDVPGFEGETWLPPFGVTLALVVGGVLLISVLIARKTHIVQERREWEERRLVSDYLEGIHQHVEMVWDGTNIKGWRYAWEAPGIVRDFPLPTPGQMQQEPPGMEPSVQVFKVLDDKDN